MAWGALYTVSIAIFVPGLLLFIFPNRYMSHIDGLRDDGKSYIWEERFTGKLALLLCVLEDEVNISDNLTYLSDRAKNDSMNIDDKTTEYADSLENNIPYLPKVIKLSIGLREDLNRLNDLDCFFEDIVQHRRYIGISIMAWAISAVLTNYATEYSWMEYEKIIIIALTIAFGVLVLYNLYRMYKKQEKIEEFGNKSRRY